MEGTCAVRHHTERSTGDQPPLSTGEVHFFWWFIQGSIMDVGVRQQLVRGWGLCDRHTAGWLTVEAAFRNGFLHGPAVLYADLMQRALKACDAKRPRLAARLRGPGLCHLCAMDLGPDSNSFCPAQRLQQGRDAAQFRKFMERTREHWAQTVCGACAGTRAKVRCRSHLCDELDQRNRAVWEINRELVRRIAERMARYERSFIWEHRGTDTAADRSALISAAGWCGGWRGLLAVCPPAG